MNERIRELALQAGYKPLSPPTFADELNEIFMQKFAELIVKDCAKIAYQNDVAKFTRDGYVIGQEIEKHFGVEQ
jgi:hypothetical protein